MTIIIHEVFSIQEMSDNALMIDSDFTGISGERQRTPYVYRPSDEYGMAPYFREWLETNEFEILPYVPAPEPTPEEIREQMRPVSRRQLRLTLVRNGIPLSSVEAAVDAIEDDLAREEAKIEWADATEYHRTHALLKAVGHSLNLTEDQIDTMWYEALEA